MVNRSEEKVRVHMNVVPRSTMNTNGGTENLSANLTHEYPMGVNPSKGNHTR